MRLRHVYLIFCAFGFVLPYSQFVPWLLEHGLALSLFTRDLFANRIGAFFGIDVLASAIVLCVFCQQGRPAPGHGESLAAGGRRLCRRCLPRAAALPLPPAGTS